MKNYFIHNDPLYFPNRHSYLTNKFKIDPTTGPGKVVKGACIK